MLLMMLDIRLRIVTMIAMVKIIYINTLRIIHILRLSTTVPFCNYLVSIAVDFNPASLCGPQ